MLITQWSGPFPQVPAWGSRFIFLRLGIIQIRSPLTASYHRFAIRSQLIKGGGDKHRRETLSKGGVIAMRFEKPKKKSGRPDFVDGRIADLERQLATETNETRKSELLAEINEWQRSRPRQKRDAGTFER